MKKLVFLSILALLIYAGSAIAQNKIIDVSKIPATADKPEQFAPAGWKIEEAIKGDLNGDGKPDYAIKIVLDNSATPKDAPAPDNDRVLILTFGDGGKLKLVAVADNLLQCTDCGGALFGIGQAPADVSIEKGVLIISQEAGSREVSDTTYRFRFDEQPNMFILIGFDYAEHDRGNGDESTESTNYLTGKRITTLTRKGHTTTKTTVVKKMRYSLSEVNGTDMAGEAAHRLHLD
jgi:hypothetical protein